MILQALNADKQAARHARQHLITASQSDTSINPLMDIGQWQLNYLLVRLQVTFYILMIYAHAIIIVLLPSNLIIASRLICFVSLICLLDALNRIVNLKLPFCTLVSENFYYNKEGIESSIIRLRRKLRQHLADIIEWWEDSQWDSFVIDIDGNLPSPQQFRHQFVWDTSHWQQMTEAPWCLHLLCHHHRTDHIKIQNDGKKKAKKKAAQISSPALKSLNLSGTSNARSQMILIDLIDWVWLRAHQTLFGTGRDRKRITSTIK